jgi:hypothetical protein
VIWLLAACSRGPAFCAERADDADCDGVPDAADRCPESEEGAWKDRLGCTEAQAAGCSTALLSPEDRDRVTGPALFRWEGDCEHYLLQLSDDPAFPAAATRTAVRTAATEATASGNERYWRVTGGLRGSSSGAASEARELRWR